MGELRHYLRASCDTTRSCNLRCKFCFNDFSVKPFHMTPEIFADMLKIVKYVPGAEAMDGQGFYFSCLWEPSLNPNYIKLLQMIPAEDKHKIFFTSNFARKFDLETIEALAKANVEYINISIESFERERYKKLTGGSDFNYEMFMENLQTVAKVFAKTPNAPKLRYISMALKTNVDELETIIEKGQTELNGYVSEIRTPFFGEYLNQFPEELLSKQEVDALRAKLDASDKRIVYALEEVHPPTKGGAKKSAEGNTSKGEKLPALVLEELVDYFYDMQIESTGDIFWRGDSVWHRYDPDADIDQVLTDGLVRLQKAEAKRHVISGTEIQKYVSLKKSFFTKTDFTIDGVEESEGFASIRGWAGVRGMDSEKMGKVLELTNVKNKAEKHYYLCQDEPRADVKEAVNPQYGMAGFKVFLDKEELSGNKFTAKMYYLNRETNRIEYASKIRRAIACE